MSGSFEELDVPPTLVSFAVTTEPTSAILSPELKDAGNIVTWLRPTYGADGLPEAHSLLETLQTVSELNRAGALKAAYTPTYGGVAEGVMKMAFGNQVGFSFDDNLSIEDLFGYAYGSFILEFADPAGAIGTPLGITTQSPDIAWKGEAVGLSELLETYESKLAPVYPMTVPEDVNEVPTFTYRADKWPAPKAKQTTKPRVLIPVFPGTNGEYEAAKAMRKAGAEPELLIIRNRSESEISESISHFATRVKNSQMIFIPGGSVGGDEPGGSAKLITTFFSKAQIRDQVSDLLDNRDGLMLGLGNGFQALLKLGLVPYGEFVDGVEDGPTLAKNTIGRHQSRIAQTRVASNLSPWLMNLNPGQIFSVPVASGEGRFVAPAELVEKLATRGQIATQYVDLEGVPTEDLRFNPFGSEFAIEGITSPDGRVLGKMGHNERVSSWLYQNVPGDYDMGLFASGVAYFG